MTEPAERDDTPTEVLPAVGPAAEPDDDPFVEELWAPPRRTGRLTKVLLAALLVAIGFLLGVTVEKVVAAAARDRVTTQQPATPQQPATQPRTAGPGGG